MTAGVSGMAQLTLSPSSIHHRGETKSWQLNEKQGKSNKMSVSPETKAVEIVILAP